MTIDIEQLKADIEAGTPGPWTYRPHRYDDWGLIRGGDDYPVASASTCRASDREKDKHRTNKTDPSFNNARRIARVPDMEARILSDADRIAALEAKVAEAYDEGAADLLTCISENKYVASGDKRRAAALCDAMPNPYREAQS